VVPSSVGGPIIIEMVPSIHIQYMAKYFINFFNYLNHFISIIS
jgi:hypothetical protein